MNKREIIIYETVNGIKPVDIWLKSIKDPVIRFRISSRIDRIKTGNLGEWKSLTDGVCELKLRFSSGYRVYYSELDNILLLLLCGGDKGSQERDIKKAIEYLKDYKERINEK
jgi:putative addiction module killer protein